MSLKFCVLHFDPSYIDVCFISSFALPIIMDLVNERSEKRQ